MNDLNVKGKAQTLIVLRALIMTLAIGTITLAVWGVMFVGLYLKYGD